MAFHSHFLLSFLTLLMLLLLFPSPTQSNSHKSNPHHSKPHRSNPHHSKPQRSNPHHSKPHQPNPQQSNPNQPNPQQSNPNHPNPQQSNPNHPNPQQSNTNQPNPQQSNPQQPNPQQPNLQQSNSELTENYYEKTCPKFNDIVQQIVTDKQMQTPTTAAAVLRLFFHDCVLEGCDASLLIASNAFNKAERDDEHNVNLPGDGFDVITRIKTSLELQCPGIVSCADIVSAAARNLVNMVGGPHYRLHFGRKDGLVSRADRVPGHYPNVSMTVDEMIKLFADKDLTVQDLVALSGAHTIGFSHCKEFANRIFNFSKTADIDPALSPNFAQGLRKLCANYTTNPGMSAFNDVMTPGKFDNMYFINLQRGLGLLASDHVLVTDQRTKPLVDLYAANQTKFFEDFANSMQKVSFMKVKTGNQGEVRRRCDAFNSLKT